MTRAEISCCYQTLLLNQLTQGNGEWIDQIGQLMEGLRRMSCSPCKSICFVFLNTNTVAYVDTWCGCCIL